MAKAKKWIIPVAVCAGIATVGVGIYIISLKSSSTFSKREALFRISPGFKRTVQVIYPSQTEKVLDYPCGMMVGGTPQLVTETSTAYGNSTEKYSLEIEEDFSVPITISVISKDTDSSKRETDRAISIQSSEGDLLVCHDYHSHGNMEVMHAPSGTSKKFTPKQGSYILEIWNYHQPAKEHKIVISEQK